MEKTAILLIVIMMVSIGLLSGCSEQDSITPVINSFTATPAVINIGDTSVLNWSVSGATTVSINNGIGNVDLDGSYSVVPTINQTYTLIAFNLFGNSKKSIVVIVNPAEIKPDSSESPIEKYFTTPKILWTFDDYYIEYNYYPPHKGYDGLTEKIISYGGNVNIMTIFTDIDSMLPLNNEIRNYSVINDFGWSQDNINKSLEFFSREGITVGCHGWRQSSEDEENLNHANLDYAYKIINYTFWNWKNNYNITPHFFLGPSASGNYNITLALKRFSENYWTIYGENFRAYNTTLFPIGSKPAIEYIGEASYVTMFDPLFGRNWDNPCKTLQDAQKLYNDSSFGKEILFIRGHPSLLNRTDQNANLTLWQQWIDWIYKSHELININHTEAIQYNSDRYNFAVIKNSDTNYTIDLTECKFEHNILFKSPNEHDLRLWNLYDENGKLIGKIQGETFLNVEPGLKYYFTIY